MSLDLGAAALVLFSAVLHATWNALTKIERRPRGDDGRRDGHLRADRRRRVVLPARARAGGAAVPGDLVRVPLRLSAVPAGRVPARRSLARVSDRARARADAGRAARRRVRGRGAAAGAGGRDRARVGRDGELRVRAARAAPGRRALGRVGVRGRRDDRLLHVPRRPGRAPRGERVQLRRLELLGDEPRLLRVRARPHARPARARSSTAPACAASPAECSRRSATASSSGRCRAGRWRTSPRCARPASCSPR